MPESRQAVIVAARRTPIGTAGRALRHVQVEDLAAALIPPVLADARLAGSMATGEGPAVEEVVLGNVMGPGGDTARVAALAAGLGHEVPGVTVDRQCGSGLEAVNLAAALVRAGQAAVVLAGGAESASTAPWRLRRPRVEGELPVAYDRAPFAPVHVGDPEMGEAAETVARERGVSRARQDEYAAGSHARAFAAARRRAFTAELVPVGGLAGDERIRDGMTADRLSRLRPAFAGDGTVTAGNSCGVNDGAAMVAVVDDDVRAALGAPGLRVAGWHVAGVDPNRCGLGIVPAVRGVLARTGVGIDEIGAVEMTEAFAAQVLACLDELKLDRDIVCADGGAIALGHPWGASGAVLLVRLFTRMVREDGPRYGLAACAVGGGQGVATLVERLS